MAITFNIRHLENHVLHLKGELAPAELELSVSDELTTVSRPVDYDLIVTETGDEILAQGKVHLTLDCQCARCLKPFTQEVNFPNWTTLLAREGPEKVTIHNDLVDLTPYLREDILLEFPQHPLCRVECEGLTGPASGPKKENKSQGSSAWSELNKLKF